jgi:alpha-glucoside transport system permease protein
MHRLLQIIIATALAPTLVVLVIWLGERVLGRLPYAVQQRLRPWLWITPAAVLVAVFLGFPLLDTIYLSFRDAEGSAFVGLDNYRRALGDRDTKVALRNNVLWLALFVPATLTFGLVLAAVTDRVRYERVAKTIVFLPMAISMVATATIWRFMYDYRPPGSPQVGTVNAVYLALGVGDEPQAWLVNTSTNNLAIILAGVWMLTGFAMVILSAAIKGVPAELREAARVDGASEWMVFSRITMPLIRPTLVVVGTTLFIGALKTFDIVWVLTNGNFETGVIGTEMYRQLFTAQHDGRAAVLAVLLLLATTPVIIVNVRNHRRQVAGR